MNPLEQFLTNTFGNYVLGGVMLFTGFFLSIAAEVMNKLIAPDKQHGYWWLFGLSIFWTTITMLALPKIYGGYDFFFLLFMWFCNLGVTFLFYLFGGKQLVGKAFDTINKVGNKTIDKVGGQNEPK